MYLGQIAAILHFRLGGGFCTLDVLQSQFFIFVFLFSIVADIYFIQHIFLKMLCLRVFSIHFLWSGSFNNSQGLTFL